MKTYLLKTESGIALEIDGVVSKCTLDYSEEVAKWIADKWGIVDVEKLAMGNWEIDIIGTTKIINPYAYVMGFKNGFKVAQSLNSEKEFTREEVLQVAGYATQIHDEQKINNYISSLRPNKVECTVEMEIVSVPYPPIIVGVLKTHISQPKIVNNTIKVLTIKNNAN